MKMKKWLTSLLMAMLTLLCPMAVFADKNQTNPFEHMETSGFFNVDWTILDKFTSFQKIFAFVITVILIVMLVLLFWDIVMWAWGLRSGKSSFKDPKFFIESGIVFGIIVLYSTGALLDILKGFYGLLLGVDFA